MWSVLTVCLLISLVSHILLFVFSFYIVYLYETRALLLLLLFPARKTLIIIIIIIIIIYIIIIITIIYDLSFNTAFICIQWEKSFLFSFFFINLADG